jgi:hypothetical protein
VCPYSLRKALNTENGLAVCFVVPLIFLKQARSMNKSTVDSLFAYPASVERPS